MRRQRLAQGVPGQAVVLHRHQQRIDAQHVQRLAHRRVGLLADGHHRVRRCPVAHPVGGGVAPQAGGNIRDVSAKDQTFGFSAGPGAAPP